MQSVRWIWLFGGFAALTLLYIVWSGLAATGTSPLAALRLHSGHATAIGHSVSQAAIPLAADMTDPYLDPVALLMSHDHASASEQTPQEQAVQVKWSWPDGIPAAGKTSLLVLSVTDGSGQSVPEFMVSSEKLMHLIMVSDDLEHFQHLHPVHKGNGIFEIPISFQEGGVYKLYADFIPVGLNELTRSLAVEASGPKEAPENLQPSQTLTATTNDMQVTLHVGHLMPGMPSDLTFSFRDKQIGKPVTDMEPYLGSIGHAVAIDEATEQYIHVHPLNWASSGPIATFAVTFPKAGLYKVWGQFQRNGEPIIIPFVIEVPEQEE